jgi:hypothetical protein
MTGSHFAIGYFNYQSLLKYQFASYRLFRDVERYEVTQSEVTAVYPAKLDAVHKKVLKLLGVPLSNYQ